MRKLLLFGFVGLIGLTLTVAAEDLGDVARKEKAKRQTLQDQGKSSKVLTNEDIEKMKAAQNAQENEEAEGTQGVAGITDAEDSDSSADLSGSVDEVAGAVEAIEETAGPTVDEQLKELEALKEKAEAQLNDAEGAIDRGGLFHTYAIGNQFRESREAQGEINEVDQQQKKLEQQKRSQQASTSEPDQKVEEQTLEEGDGTEPPE